MKTCIKTSDLTSPITFGKYKNLLKKDLGNLTEGEDVPFVFFGEFEFKGGDSEPLLIIGSAGEDWEEAAGIRADAKEDCQALTGEEETIQVDVKGGDLDKITKLLKVVGYETIGEDDAEKEIKKRTKDQEDLLASANFFLEKMEKTLNYADSDLSPLIKDEPETDSEEITGKRKKLRETLTAAKKQLKAIIVDKVYSKQIDGLVPAEGLEGLVKKMEKFKKNFKKLIKEAKDDLGHLEDGPTYNDIVYKKVSKSTIQQYDDEGHLAELATGELDDRHPKGDMRFNKPLHQHLDGGSKGMAFYYRIESDGNISPIVYDFASNRNGNKYQWKNGGQLSGPPKF